MKRWAWITAILLVVFGVGGAWFWSLAAVPPEAVPSVTLEVQQSSVTVTLPGDSTAHDATNGMILPQGAVVKTGESGRAVIHFYDRAESRVASNSQVTITDASAGADGKLNVQLDLQKGRTWSRVLRLFDLDSSFAVKTPSVVATVRGTAFDVRANNDGTSDVWVAESAVSVTPASGAAPSALVLPADNTFRVATSTPVLTSGETAHYAKDGKPLARSAISDEDKASAWFTENRAADEIFQRDEATQVRKTLDGRSGVVGRAVNGLTQASERLHLALTGGSNKDRLAETYMARDITSAVTLAENGKSGLAAQAFSRIENDLKNRLSGSDGATARRQLHAALSRVAPLIQDSAPGSADYPFKQRLEDLGILVSSDDASALYARLRATDARLDEADRLLASGTLDDAKDALTAAHDGLGNALRDSASLLSTLDDARRSALTNKLIALLARSTTEQARLNALSVPMMAVSTSTASVPTVPAVSVATSTQSTSTSASAYSGIGVHAQPNPVDPGQTVTLSVLATKVGGGTEDVTNRATYKLIGGTGVLAKNTLVVSAPGTVVTIEADFVDQGKKMISRTAVTVNGASAVLQSLAASASPSIILSGEQTTLSAEASYSTGFQQDVGSKVTWKNATPSLGMLSGNVFIASPTAYGRAELQATYVENGVTQTATVYVVINQNTQLYRTTN